MLGTIEVIVYSCCWIGYLKVLYASIHFISSKVTSSWRYWCLKEWWISVIQSMYYMFCCSIGLSGASLRNTLHFTWMAHVCNGNRWMHCWMSYAAKLSHGCWVTLLLNWILLWILWFIGLECFECLIVDDLSWIECLSLRPFLVSRGFHEI